MGSKRARTNSGQLATGEGEVWFGHSPCRTMRINIRQLPAGISALIAFAAIPVSILEQSSCLLVHSDASEDL